MRESELDNWIVLDPHHRIAMYRDNVPMLNNPLEEAGGEVGCFPVRTARGLNGIFADLPVCDELMELSKAALHKEIGYDHDELTVDMIKHLHGMGYETMELELRGYSQGEWIDVILWVKKGAESESILKHTARDLGCWFRGDVFMVAVEELVTYYGSNDREIVRWEILESVDPAYGIYFDGIPEVEDLVGLFVNFDLADYGVENVDNLELVN